MAPQKPDIEIHRHGKTPAVKGPMIVLAIAAIFIISMVVYSTASDAPDDHRQATASSGDQIDLDKEVHVSDVAAQRIHEISDSAAWPAPPMSREVSGVVIAVADHVISMQSDATTFDWPLASDVAIWKNGQRVSVDDMKPDDEVTVFLQQLGSREKGWLNSVVKIQVNSSKHGITQGEAPATVDVLSRPLRYVGEVKDVGSRQITISDQFDDERFFAVEPGAIAERGKQSGGIAIVRVGDRVELFGTRTGNRTDGWTVLINRVVVITD